MNRKLQKQTFVFPANRKGQSTTYDLMRGGLMLVVVLLVSVSLYYMIFNNANKMLDDRKCRDSITAHIQVLKATNGKTAPDIECPIITEELSAKNEEQVKLQLAERMKTCWSTWREGKENLFIEEGTYCHPCYILDFKNKDIEVKDFEKYLIGTDVKGKDYSYMQYLSGYSSDEEFQLKQIMENPEIAQLETQFSTDSRKIIIFYYLKDRQKIKEFQDKYTKEIGLGIGGAAIGATIGAIALGGACGAVSFGLGAPACASIGYWAGGIAGAIIGVTVGKITADNYPQWISQIQLRDYHENELVNLGCDFAPAKQTNI